MPKKPLGDSERSDVDAGRRKFLRTSGAALASGVALSSMPVLAGAAGDEKGDREEGSAPERVSHRSWKRPNLLLIITDQERFPQHWPEGWADANLPNRKRLADHGLTFTRAFCASAMCTPSRATLFTGLYPSEHKVDQTLRYGTGPSAVVQPTLQPPPDQGNMASMLESAGYDVQYRGKWHISKDPSGIQEVVSRKDLENYHFRGWEPPEGGADQNPSGFGGGTTNYDERYASQVIEFLTSARAHTSKPFALIVCLINPHDIMSYPGVPPIGWNSTTFSDVKPYKGSDNYGGVDLNAPPLDQIDLPKNFQPEDFKPPAQAQSTLFWGNDNVLGPLTSEDQGREYLRFFAYLHQRSDEQIGRILDALESRPALHRNTLVIRLSDHGEMGLSHGGMRQKAYSAYEETIHVPLVISNPKLFPGPVQSPALASLVDLMPTLATIADVPNRQGLNLAGSDLTPVIQDAIDHPANPGLRGQESVLFTTDEILGSLPLTEGAAPIVTEPSHIRCLREERWKIVMYFDPAPGGAASVYELYDLLTDPLEQNNRADPANVTYYNPEKLSEMIAKLQNRMAQTRTAL